MTKYEIASLIVAICASIISLLAFLYAFISNKKAKSVRVFEKLNKFIVTFIDKNLPNTSRQFALLEEKHPIINARNASKMDDLISNIRSKLFDYKELIDKMSYKKCEKAINDYEDSYMELCNNQSAVNIQNYKENYDNLVRALHSFIKTH